MSKSRIFLFSRFSIALLFCSLSFSLFLFPFFSEKTRVFSAPPERNASQQEKVVLSGWFHIVWNGEPHYILSDADNHTTPLILDKAVLKTAGEIRLLNRKKVTIEGFPLSSPSGAIQVLSIVPDVSRRD